MTNLVPGALFHTPGLNHNFTPTPNTVTPKDLDKIYARQSFNGHPWPPDSPVTRMYDVCNTSTRMILLNNRKQRNSRLRGYDETEINRVPDPDRHSRASTPNPRAHRKCYDSSSPYFEPEIQTNLGWLSSDSNKSHLSYLAKSSVNPKRHTSCKVPTDPPEFRAGMTSPTQRRRRFYPPRSSMIFNYPEMSPGEKLYLWSMERTYSSKNLMSLKKNQYLQLLTQNSRGVHSYQDYIKYMRYIQRPKTAPLPVQTGWSRPKSRTTSAFGEEPQKDEKAPRSSETEKEKQIKPGQQEKSENTKVGLSTAQAVTGIRSPPRSRPSSLRSRNGSARSQTSSESQESTKREEDTKETKDIKDKKHEPIVITKTIVEEKEENSNEPSTPSTENDIRLTKHKEGVDRPKSRSGHMSPKGSVHEKSKEEDTKPTDVKQEEAPAAEVNKSEEHDSRPSTVLSIHENAERPESGKSTISAGKVSQTQANNDEVEENQSKLSNKAESLVSIKSNDSQQLSRARRDSVEKDTDGKGSGNIHKARRDSDDEDNENKKIQSDEDSEEEENKKIQSDDEDSEGEENKKIHQARSGSEEKEDGETWKGSEQIHGARRDSIDEDDDRRGNKDVDKIQY